MNQIVVIDADAAAWPVALVEVLPSGAAEAVLVEILPPAPPITIEIASAGAMGPQGIQGEVGPKGDKGDKGETGVGVIGGSITISATPPANPGTNDVWIDIS